MEYGNWSFIVQVAMLSEELHRYSLMGLEYY